MWSLLTGDAGKSLTGALERAGEALTKGATNVQRRSTESTPTTAPAGFAVDGGTVEDIPLSQRFQLGWGSVLVATKNAVEATREVVEKEQSRFLHFNSVKRDPRAPLDVEALRDAEVVYVTDRLITMGHPAMQSQVDGNITPTRKLKAVAHLLDKRHQSKYMIWNLSEVEYDSTLFDSQVLTFSFPGSPSPPLGLLLKLLISMESWLKADPRNVAVVHCLTGKGRTSTVLAAFLCWIGEAGFGDVHKALEYIAKCKHLTVEELTIPSQRRYVSYFANMLDGVRPSQPPLMLKRIIMSEAPKFAKGPPRQGQSPDIDDSNEEDDMNSRLGCAPYLQIFKAGQLVFTTAASLNYQQGKDELPFCYLADGPIAFQLENIVQGDILLRCRHLTANGQRISMFRAAFHTGYVPPNVMRLTKAQLDGACADKRFPDEFFLDLIFEPCEAEMASKHLSGKADTLLTTTTNNMDAHESQNEAAERRSRGTMAGASPPLAPAINSSSGGGATVTASAYDSMLHRDSRFWDVIAARRQEHVSKRNDADPMWGPTIGKRRDLSARNPTDAAAAATGAEGAGNNKSDTDRQNSLEAAFSIGGEFDFFDIPEEPAPTVQAGPPKRDELMEALMALDDEGGSPQATRKVIQPDVEEIVFEMPNPTMVTLPPLKPKDSGNVSSESSLTDDKQEMEFNAASKASSVADATSIDDDPDLNVDADMDAFLESTGVDGDMDGETEDADDLDFDDDDLEDLENFLSQATK